MGLKVQPWGKERLELLEKEAFEFSEYLHKEEDFPNAGLRIILAQNEVFAGPWLLSKEQCSQMCPKTEQKQFKGPSFTSDSALPLL